MTEESTAPLRRITEEEVSAYERDGVVLLKGIVDGDWIAFASEAVDELYANPGPNARRWRVSAAHSEFYEEAELSERSAAIREFVRDSPTAEIASMVMRSETATCIYDQIFIKEPGHIKGTDWHQDLPYFPADGSQLCVIWMALDKVEREHSLEFVRASHRSGQLFHFAGSGHGEIDLPTVPDVYSDPEKYEIVGWPTEPGDLLIFHLATLHGSQTRKNVPTRRRTLSTRWAGDDARYTLTNRVPDMRRSVPLRQGDKLPCDIFPQVWPRKGSP